MLRVTCFLLVFLSSIMSLFARTPEVCFVTLHPGPAQHFAEYAKVLSEQEIAYEIYAGDFAEAILRDKKVPHKRINVWTKKEKLSELPEKKTRLIAKLLAHKITNSKIIITDISDQLITYLFEELNLLDSKSARFVYYDNPQAYVNPCYSNLLQQLIEKKPSAVLFSNHKLASLPILSEKKSAVEFDGVDKIGIGFTPMTELELLKELKQDKQAIRKKLFDKLKIIDSNQKVLLYLGGANHQYFNEGFPLFIQMISAKPNRAFFEDHLLLLQQHPRAKTLGDFDASYIKNHRVPCVLSPLTTLESLSISDLTYYYQTSMSPKLLLGRFPILQVADEKDEDELVTEGYLTRSSTASSLLIDSHDAMERVLETDLEKVHEHIGFTDSWRSNFVDFVERIIN